MFEVRNEEFSYGLTNLKSCSSINKQTFKKKKALVLNETSLAACKMFPGASTTGKTLHLKQFHQPAYFL